MWYPRVLLRWAPLALLAAVALYGCGSGEPGDVRLNVQAGLTRGRVAAEQWIAQARDGSPPPAETTIAVGYLERLRLGLGSPFRLVDHVLHDPRLADTTRVQAGWALLARTLDGDAYHIDPVALDRIGPEGTGSGGIGRQHLELIEGAVSEARDPRGGELAVRLAYALASAEGIVDRRAPSLAAQAAALLRDRELARRDARRLLRSAESGGHDPLALLSEWRAERRFEVEQPHLMALPLETEREALELAPRLAHALRSLVPRLVGGRLPAARAPSNPLLGLGAAAHLSALADALDSPPQAPVAIAVGQHSRVLLSPPNLSVVDRAARQRFIERAVNEERFVAEYAALARNGDRSGGELARVALATAVALRTYAQEQVWFPGFGGPSTRELEDRFGLAAVEFEDTPAAWRPYYRRMLAEALTDLQRVLPSLDLRGLVFRFGESRTKAATLAIHDPRQRTIYLPPATGAGTIAHEVAHDLDWQVAVRRYRVRGDYASDRATRQGNDPLARSLQSLTTATLVPPVPGDPTPPAHASRPAEVFARSMDWFIVVSLAREGRMNGYLSSVQDDLLTGYGTVAPPDITGTAGLALMRILDEIAPVYRETREWFLRNYGPNRPLTAYDLVRQVVEASAVEAVEIEGQGTDLPVVAARPDGDVAVLDAGGRPNGDTAAGDVGPEPGDTVRVPLAAPGTMVPALGALAEARDAALAAIDAWACQLPVIAYEPRLEIARRRLVADATAARARGIVLDAAARVAGADGMRWMARRLYGAPWPLVEPEPAAVELLEEFAREAERLGEVQLSPETGPFLWAMTPRACGERASLALR